MSRRKRLPLPRLRTWRARLTALAVLIVVLGGIAAGAYIYERNRTGSIYNKGVKFEYEKTAKKPVTPTKSKKHKAPFVWAFYGYTKDHHRFFPAPSTMRPPFKQVWESKETALLEFPPVMSGKRIFQLADDGVISAIDKETGKLLWSKDLGKLSASTPAIGGGTVFATVLARNGGEGGRIVALKARTGAIVWSRNLPSRTESSPTIVRGKVIFGSEDGTVYALRVTNGSTVWTYHASGAVKASPTLYKGILYFGDYSGQVQAISAGTGQRIWIAGSEGAPLGSGTFYSTAAVAYGRVYLGNTDGRIYAYEAKTGALAWAVQTGAYVYASPAVTNVPGLGPTIFEGSYDGNFYALNARTGAIDWTYDAHGKISGSATIVGKYVYFSDLGTHSTTGLLTINGHRAFWINQGAFDPVISDGEKLYLDGYATLYALSPRGQTQKRTQTRSTQSKTSQRHGG